MLPSDTVEVQVRQPDKDLVIIMINAGFVYNCVYKNTSGRSKMGAIIDSVLRSIFYGIVHKDLKTNNGIIITLQKTGKHMGPVINLHLIPLLKALSTQLAIGLSNPAFTFQNKFQQKASKSNYFQQETFRYCKNIFKDQYEQVYIVWKVISILRPDPASR